MVSGEGLTWDPIELDPKPSPLAPEVLLEALVEGTI